MQRLEQSVHRQMEEEQQEFHPLSQRSRAAMHFLVIPWKQWHWVRMEQRCKPFWRWWKQSNFRIYTFFATCCTFAKACEWVFFKNHLLTFKIHIRFWSARPGNFCVLQVEALSLGSSQSQDSPHLVRGLHIRGSIKANA